MEMENRTLTLVCDGSLQTLGDFHGIGTYCVVRNEEYSSPVMVDAKGIKQALVAPGGTIANVGVHGKKVDLHLERLWSQNISITTRLVDTATTRILLKAVASKKLDPSVLITHRFPLDRILDAYDTFSKAAETKALKVIISP